MNDEKRPVQIMQLDTSTAKRLIRKAMEQPIDLFGHIEGLVDWLYTNLVEHQITEFTDLWAKKIDATIVKNEGDVVELADFLSTAQKKELAIEWLSEEGLSTAQKKELAIEWLSEEEIKKLVEEYLSEDDVEEIISGLAAQGKVNLMRKWIDEPTTVCAWARHFDKDTKLQLVHEWIDELTKQKGKN